jgi:hypothetical protein
MQTSSGSRATHLIITIGQNRFFHGTNLTVRHVQPACHSEADAHRIDAAAGESSFRPATGSRSDERLPEPPGKFNHSEILKPAYKFTRKKILHDVLKTMYYTYYDPETAG